MSPILGSGNFSYEWDGSWFAGRHHDGSSQGWAHHGIVATRDGNILTFHEEKPEVMVFDRTGELLASWAAPIVEGHGMALVTDGGVEHLWISDNGSKNRRVAGGAYAPDPSPVAGTVTKFTLDGQVVTKLPTPPLPIYETGDYGPTQVAVDEESAGGTGDIWVSDCYGQGIVHRFDKNGVHVGSIDGEEGAGRFAHPHAVYIDRRGAAPELYVADRRNKRVQVYDLEGRFLRTFGESYLVSPSGFVAYGDNLLISELDSRIILVDSNNELLVSIGDASNSDRTRPGWPNATDASGAIVRPPLSDGTFNTPHGVAADAAGDIYVTEWLIGGRLVKLSRTR